MENTRTQASSVKKKLTAAIAMLLIAVLMVVNSTYAWFTLSTAPEVTGIQTTVGANGSLEMALAKNGTAPVVSAVGDSLLPTAEKNLTWGNLVDLSDASYGLSNIKLMPAALNVTDGKIHSAFPLKTPVYGADGRVESLAANATFGIWNGSGFVVPADDADVTNGVRVIGTSAQMTAQQIAFKNSLVTLNANAAKTIVANSLSTYGSDIAKIMLTHESDANATHDATNLGAAITSLKSANAEIAKSIKAAILAAAAKANENADEVTWTAIAGAINGAELSALIAGGDFGGYTAPAVASGPVKDAYDKYVAIDAALTTAQTKFEAIVTVTAATWAEVSPVLTALVDPTKVTVNGQTLAQIQTPDGKNAFVNSTLNGGGVTVTTPTGSGVYADFSDLCGNYSASVTLTDVTYAGITLTTLNAQMVTATTVNPTLVNAVVTLLNGAGAPAASAGVTGGEAITDTYGYVLDFWFRTNADSSYLKLQTEGTDRIYGEDGTNDEVKGSGSTVTFHSVDLTKFSTADVSNLMDAIRIAFADSEGNVLAYGMLTGKTINGNEVTAKIVLGTCDAQGQWTANSGADAAKLIDLQKNVATMVSVYVYLDGTVVDNSDVANATSSMTGTMNLQFSSSADLVPMDYSPLQ